MNDQKDHQVNTADNVGSDLPAATAVLSAEDRADLVNAIKNKLHDLERNHSGFLEKLPPNIRKRVDVLRLREIQRYEIVNEAENEGTVDKEINESAAAIRLQINHVFSPMFGSLLIQVLQLSPTILEARQSFRYFEVYLPRPQADESLFILFVVTSLMYLS
ncbi:nucleosome assembly protein 1;4-like isoform X2 [Nicotiana tabacum]|uniref:Nucleosome assembly protein 14-like n=1 Tax=Nicotiana sylvestris TaxID=4096 RepID=A0A1U7XV59_NICSY|nr:PREDICTED: nucleosome assembly protein 1;4-like [Nicotiana sylvestris]